MAYQFRNLVFEGGGVRGIAYVGVMELLEELGITQQIKRAGGTSAGAINALLFCLGYRVTEQRKIMETMDFNKFMDDSFGMIRDMNSLFYDYGWFRGDYFRGWISELIAARLGSPDATFNDLYRSGKPNLYVYGTNLSTRFATIFSVTHSPTMRLADAVRISMSIPLFFKAVRDPRGDVFVDGGIQVNYPIKLFDREDYIENIKALRRTDYYDQQNDILEAQSPQSRKHVYNKETLGVRLDKKEEVALFRYGREPVHHRIDSFLDYAKALVQTIMNNQENYHLHSDDWHRTIYVDTLDVSTTDFNVSDARKKALIKSGYDCAKEYFRWFDTPKPKEPKPINRI